MLKQRILTLLITRPGAMKEEIAEALGEPPRYVDTTTFPGHPVPIGNKTERVEEALRELERGGKVEHTALMWFLKKD